MGCLGVTQEKVERAGPAGSGSSSIAGEVSLALTACTRAAAHHSATLLLGTRAAFGTRAAALAPAPAGLRPRPNRRVPGQVPASTLPQRGAPFKDVTFPG